MNKCHTDESREAAYSLFQTLIVNNPDPNVLQDLINKYWTPSIL